MFRRGCFAMLVAGAIVSATWAQGTQSGGAAAGRDGGTVDPWRPDPREIPLPPIQTGHAVMPGVHELPARPALPEVLKMRDGSAVTRENWAKRREEMKD